MSLVGSAHHHLAKWPAEILQPVLDHYSTRSVRDSFEFVETIREHEVQGRMFTCSYDVVSLITNIPINETINICLTALYNSDIPNLEVKEGLLRKLLEKCTKEVELSFNKMFRQNDGVAKGCPLGPVLANVFMGYCESLIPFEHWPGLYCRYMDDTCSVFSNERKREALLFLARLNDVHPSLKFREKEVDVVLPFLDVQVIRQGHSLEATVYRKPTFSGLYTRWDSYAPNGVNAFQEEDNVSS